MTAPITVPPPLVSTSASVRRIGLAATSGCDRVRTLVRHNADVARVATDMFGLEQEGSSAAALITGNQQEASLLRAGAAPLLEVLTAAERLRPGDMGFLDIRTLPRRRQATETIRLIADRIDGARVDVHLLAQPTFAVELWGARHQFRADFAVLPESRDVSLGEKKSFHDFQGDTDQPAMRSLLDQGGGYYGLQDIALRAAGFGAQADRLEPVLDAVLRGPRVYRLSVADEKDRTLRMLSAETAVDLADTAADAARAAGTTELNDDFVRALAVNRGSHCTACPLRNLCRDESYAAGDLTILSTQTRPAAVPAGTAFRAAALVSGAARPAPQERELAQDAAAVRAELQGAGWQRRRFRA